MLGPHLFHLPPLPHYHCNLWPLLMGQPSPCVYTVPFLLVEGWEGVFFTEQGIHLCLP